MRSVPSTSTSPSSDSHLSSPSLLQAAWILGPHCSPQGKGETFTPSPPQLDKKQPKRELTCPRPLVKPSDSHFLPLLPLLHLKETEAESRSYSPGQMRRLAWAMVSHASHWDVFRQSDTWVHPKFPLTYLSSGKLGHPAGESLPGTTRPCPRGAGLSAGPRTHAVRAPRTRTRAQRCAPSARVALGHLHPLLHSVMSECLGRGPRERGR